MLETITDDCTGSTIVFLISRDEMGLQFYAGKLNKSTSEDKAKDSIIK